MVQLDAGWALSSHLRWYMLQNHNIHITSGTNKMSMPAVVCAMCHVCLLAVVQKVAVKRNTRVKKASCLQADEFDAWLAFPEVHPNGERSRSVLQDKVICCISVSCGMLSAPVCALLFV